MWMDVKLGYEKETHKKQEGWVASYTLSDYAGMRLGMSNLESIGDLPLWRLLEREAVSASTGTLVAK